MTFTFTITAAWIFWVVLGGVAVAAFTWPTTTTGGMFDMIGSGIEKMFHLFVGLIIIVFMLLGKVFYG